MTGLFQILEPYRNDKIAIYGLGTETERVLREIGQDFQIVGLLDGYKEEGTLYHKPVIPLQYAIEQQVKLILVVARPGSCRAIRKRIGTICMDHQIDLIDVRGKNLCETQKITYHFRGEDGISRNSLMERVKANDVVTVDLFDTLVMRRTLFPSDIFEIADGRLKEKGIVIKDFSSRRLASEKCLANTTAPTLAEIYAHMINTYSIREATPEQLAQLEWEIDYELLVARQEMCDFCEEAYHKGKEIYIVSDTFYSREQLVKLLEKCGIKFYTEIFSSCEYRTAKTAGLFERVKEKLCGRKCIHIGDDFTADIESARQNGLEACQIRSGADLLEMTGYLGLWDHIDGLSNRIKVGMFTAKLFNSPFQFEEKKTEIEIDNAYELGYLLFAPMISDFVIWFAEQVRKYALPNVWLCARDGYLVKKMYDELCKEESSVYFLTSRTAAIRAGVENEEDIRYVSEMKFSGTVAEELQERFGISGAAGTENQETCAESLTEYSQAILRKAAVHRINYHKYMESLQIKEGDVAFFDFVAKGTSQMYIQRLTGNHLKGLYFLQLEKEYMKEKGLDILSFYAAEEAEHSAIYENYYILETMLTSPMPSVKEFDGRGEPCYAHETRKNEDIICAQEAQDGIFDYFAVYLKICPKSALRVNRELDEQFLTLVHGMVVSDRRFRELKVEDPFFGRMTDMADLL